MPTFGYPQQYANGLNNNSQLRRSADMIYQRGGTYEVVLTGNTYSTSLELDVDLYSDDRKVGRMSIVPYNVKECGEIPLCENSSIVIFFHHGNFFDATLLIIFSALVLSCFGFCQYSFNTLLICPCRFIIINICVK
jgi:hypothetical protein